MSLSGILRSTSRRLLGQVSKAIPKNVAPLPTLLHPRPISHLAVHHETLEEMICRYECIFNREDADGWDVRQAMNDLNAYDAVPDPRIIIAGLYACRRLNDYAMAVRFLEMVKNKCGTKVHEFYPYIIQEVGPTVAELGCDFPETLGYDQPELYLENVFEM